MEFILNDRHIKTDKPGGFTLLDFIRYEKGLMGTKIGCREGDCGACTVLVGQWNGKKVEYLSMTSCITPLANVTGKHVVSIEGLNLDDLSPVQQAFVDAGGTQCGFCTVGFIVSLTGYCLSAKNASYPGGISAIDGNICRCTGYKSIERAVEKVVEQLKDKDKKNSLAWLVEQKFLPGYFKKIPEMLAGINRPALPANGTNGVQKAGIVAGGTDLYVQRPEDFHHAEINPFFGAHSLTGITEDDTTCKVGASTTVSDILDSDVFRKLFPKLYQYLKLVSSTQIRNMGTLGGNLVNASPIGDMTIFFLALNSTLELRNAKGTMRSILLRDFYKGYKTLDKANDEFIQSITFSKLPGSHFNFEKVSKRTNLDIASVNSAVRLTVQDDTIEEIHLSAGGVGPVPTYLRRTCTFLMGKKLTGENLGEALQIATAEISPISDARGSKEYKSLLARQLMLAHFIELFPAKFEMEMFA